MLATSRPRAFLVLGPAELVLVVTRCPACGADVRAYHPQRWTRCGPCGERVPLEPAPLGSA